MHKYIEFQYLGILQSTLQTLMLARPEEYFILPLS